MKVKKNKLIWMLFYIILLSYMIMQYATIHQFVIFDSQMIYDLVESPQKLLFNTTILFILYLYISRVNFLEPELLIRYNRRLSKILIKHGIYSSIIYTFLTFSILILCSVIIGIPIQVGIYLLLHILKLFIFCLYISFVYLSIYIISVKQILAFFVILTVNFLLLVSYVGLNYYGGITNMIVIKHNNMNWFIFGFITIVSMSYLYTSINKKEYIK